MSLVILKMQEQKMYDEFLKLEHKFNILKLIPKYYFQIFRNVVIDNFLKLEKVLPVKKL